MPGPRQPRKATGAIRPRSSVVAKQPSRRTPPPPRQAPQRTQEGQPEQAPALTGLLSQTDHRMAGLSAVQSGIGAQAPARSPMFPSTFLPPPPPGLA